MARHTILIETAAVSHPGATAQGRVGTSLHTVGQSSLVLVASQARIYHLDPSASAIAWALAEGEPAAALATMLADATHISWDEAQSHIAMVQGMLWPAPQPSGVERDGPLRWRPEEAPATAPLETRHYRLLDLCFDCAFADRTARDLAASAFAHLEVPQAGATATRFLVEAAAGQVLVRRDRLRLDAIEQPLALVNLLRIAFAEAALEGSTEAWAAHAAAVSRDGPAILLPGPAGTGKSTLALGLGAAGWTVYGDDTVVLSAAALEVRPMTLPLCVKRGSWLLAKSLLGTAGCGTAGRRPDGVDVRWLAYSGRLTKAEPAARAAIGHIVFPVFDPMAHTMLQPLDVEETLRRMVPGLHALGPGLTPEKVDQLIAWASSRPRFELRYSSLAEGIAILEGLQG